MPTELRAAVGVARKPWHNFVRLVSAANVPYNSAAFFTCPLGFAFRNSLGLRIFLLPLVSGRFRAYDLSLLTRR
ncbi:MAG TPA: hypothetical protein VKD19_06810 [Pseudolabrys sp.]|jgi:hypothetical protein|nr:hypothetical protein [Pseudolabrys sp.]